MPSNPTTQRFAGIRRAATAVVALGAVAALTFGISSAFAVTAKPGKYTGVFSYQGTKITSEVLTFKVSGNKVKKARITPFLPNKCGAGGPPPKETSKTGKIKNGKFTATAQELFQGKVTASTKISGKFTSPTKAKGTLKTKIKGHPECTASYTFVAKPKKGH